MYCEHYGVSSGFNLLFVSLIVLNFSINTCNFMLYKNSYVFVIYLRTVNCFCFAVEPYNRFFAFKEQS